MTDKIRWGFLGCGHIAHSFVKALLSLPEAQAIAAAAQTPGKAEAFARQYGIPRAYTSYEQLAADPEVDIVYVATTHNFHYENALLCLRHNKHVLCEKPFTINATQAQELITLAKKNKLFLMEAVWTRFMPAILAIQAKLTQGMIGTIQKVQADFWIRVPFNPNHRLYNRELAGGCLLDLGIYPLTFADLVFHEAPVKTTGNAVIGQTGVDETSYYLLEYKNGCIAQLSSSCRASAPIRGLIVGDKGYIEVPSFLYPQEFSIHLAEGKEETVRAPFNVNGYEYEIAESMRCLREGLQESPLMTTDKTLDILKLMDELRRGWNLKYPGE
jgi:predicted dehydrogenase